MTTAAKVLRYAAFGLLVFFAVFGGAFIIGDAFMDPGGLAAVLLSAAWVVPAVALAGYALWRPDAATRVLTVLAALVALFVVLDTSLDIVPRDEIGPVGSIAVFAVAVPLGFLGLHRPAPAGSLLLLLGAAELASVFAKMLAVGDGAAAGSAFGGSSGAVAIPVMIVGGLFLVAAAGELRANRERPGDTRRTHRARPAH